MLQDEPHRRETHHVFAQHWCHHDVSVRMAVQFRKLMPLQHRIFSMAILITVSCALFLSLLASGYPNTAAPVQRHRIQLALGRLGRSY